jgi:hypothetical protein
MEAVISYQLPVISILVLKVIMGSELFLTGRDYDCDSDASVDGAIALQGDRK